MVSNILTNMLTEQDIKILETEDTYTRRTGAKQRHIIEQLGMTPATYYARLHRLVRKQEVIAAWPQLAYRVGRLSDKRRDDREALLRVVS